MAAEKDVCAKGSASASLRTPMPAIKKRWADYEENDVPDAEARDQPLTELSRDLRSERVTAAGGGGRQRLPTAAHGALHRALRQRPAADL